VKDEVAKLKTIGDERVCKNDDRVGTKGVLDLNDSLHCQKYR